MRFREQSKAVIEENEEDIDQHVYENEEDDKFIKNQMQDTKESSQRKSRKISDGLWPIGCFK